MLAGRCADDHSDLYFDTYSIALVKFSGNSGSFALVIIPSQEFQVCPCPTSGWMAGRSPPLPKISSNAVLSSTRFSLWNLVLARLKRRRLKPVVLV
jgi:hypothetical protein